MNIFYPTGGILGRCAHPLSPTSRRRDAARHARLRDGFEKLGRPGSDAFDPRKVRMLTLPVGELIKAGAESRLAQAAAAKPAGGPEVATRGVGCCK